LKKPKSKHSVKSVHHKPKLPALPKTPEDPEQRSLIDKLEQQVSLLSDDDRTVLWARLGLAVEQDVIVNIYDGQQRAIDYTGKTLSGRRLTSREVMLEPRPDDISRPRALMIFGPGGMEKDQEIDILASIRADAASLGHPAIMCALRFWQGSVVCKERLPDMGRGEGKRLRECGKIAKGHLESVSRALVQGVVARAWPAEKAFEVHRRLVFDRSWYLRQIFEAYIATNSRNPDKLVAAALKRLGQDELYEDGAHRTGLDQETLKNFEVGLLEIAAFLKSPDGRFAFQRRDWRRWKNLYDESRFSLKKDVQRRYRRNARNVSSGSITHIGAETFVADSEPVITSPDRNFYSIPASRYALSLPVVRVKRG